MSGDFAALRAANFRSSGSVRAVKAPGSTEPVSSPSGRNRLATVSHLRRGIRRRMSRPGLAPGRLIPDRPETPFSDRRKDGRGGALRVEARRDEYVGIDHGAFRNQTAMRVVSVDLG